MDNKVVVGIVVVLYVGEVQGYMYGVVGICGILLCFFYGEGVGVDDGKFIEGFVVMVVGGYNYFFCYDC